jgi:hypothetical protein
MHGSANRPLRELATEHPLHPLSIYKARWFSQKIVIRREEPQ